MIPYWRPLRILLTENVQIGLYGGKNTSRTSGSSHFATVFWKKINWARGRGGFLSILSFKVSLLERSLSDLFGTSKDKYLHILYIEPTLHQASFKVSHSLSWHKFNGPPSAISSVVWPKQGAAWVVQRWGNQPQWVIQKKKTKKNTYLW